MFARSKYGGDCAAIEQYVLALLTECDCKDNENLAERIEFCGKVAEIVQFEGGQTAGCPLNDVGVKMPCLSEMRIDFCDSCIAPIYIVQCTNHRNPLTDSPHSK